MRIGQILVHAAVPLNMCSYTINSETLGVQHG